MEKSIVLVILIAVVTWTWRTIYNRRERTRAAEQRRREEAAAADPGIVSTKLHELDAVFAPFASGSAHPRELAGNAAFRQAVDLLANPALPLATIRLRPR